MPEIAFFGCFGGWSRSSFGAFVVMVGFGVIVMVLVVAEGVSVVVV